MISTNEVPISTKIAPELVPEFQKLNDNQQKAVAYDSGQLLVLAGPGSGKTHCLILCALNLLLSGKAQPDEIVLCTYTRKAAYEIQDRLLKMATKVGYKQDISQIRVDTIHEICSRFISENAHRFARLNNELPSVSSNFRTLDMLSQQLFIFSYLEEICGKQVQGFVRSWGSRWEAAKQLQKHFDKITEELINLSEMRSVEPSQLLYVGEDARRKEASLLRHLAGAYESYRQLLFDFDYIDFAHLQRIVYDLLGIPEAAEWIIGGIKYVFVDEFQDTNHIQEQLLYRLASATNNLCVVGDEDQSLYRFRGATTQNMGDFYRRFPDGLIGLTTNYRSHAKIIDVCNTWIDSISWGIYRSNNKKNRPFHKDAEHYPAVCSIDGIDKADEARQVAELVVFLKEQGKITDYDQVALLLHSVKPEQSGAYITALEEKQIPIFCSRAKAYFTHSEICLLVGCLARIFHYSGDVETGVAGENEFQEYIDRCRDLLMKECETSDALEESLRQLDIEILRISQGEELERRLLDYLYTLLAVEPFKSFLTHEKKVYNLGKFSRFIEIFENFNRYGSLTRDNLDDITSTFFNKFLCLLLKDGDNESEDSVLAFPKGCLPIMTIHQAKGLEFPVVIVGGLDRTISNTVHDDVNKRLRQFFPRQPREPMNQAPIFDYMRLFYVAFSRAINLLVLTGNRSRKPATPYLRKLKDELPAWPYIQGELPVTQFQPKSVPQIRPRHSFTSVQMFETCPRRYQFHREFKFAASRPGEFFFGLLVHQTIERIHRMALDGKMVALSENQVRTLFDQTYYALSQNNLNALSPGQKEKAFEQVMNYYVNNQSDMQYITKAEERVSIVNDEYVMTGTIDLVLERDAALEIVDLKTARKRDLNSASSEYYERQVRIYAHALEKRDQRRPDRLLIYWTEEPRRVDAVMVVPYDSEKVRQDVVRFERVVQQIKDKQFEVVEIPERHICQRCDIRNLCAREGLIQPFH